jgi:hypothetical protein
MRLFLEMPTPADLDPAGPALQRPPGPSRLAARAAASAAFAALLLDSRAGRAQGGNIGEGPGWGLFFGLVWLGSALVVGTVALVALLLLRRRAPRRPRAAGAIALAYALALPATAVAGIAGLFTESWWVPAVVLATGLGVYLAAVRRRWRSA